MAEYIERLIELLRASVCDGNCEHCEYDHSDEACISHMERLMAEHLTANGVAPVVHGRWEHHENGTAYCSECEMDAVEDGTDYCPNCGAKMDLKGGDG